MRMRSRSLLLSMMVLALGAAPVLAQDQPAEITADPPLPPPIAATSVTPTLPPPGSGTVPDPDLENLGDNQGFELPIDESQLQGALPATAESEEEKKEKIRKEAFDAALTGVMPMRPEEIRQLLEYYDKTQEAVETKAYDPPKPEVVVQTLSLDPGVEPFIIKVASGHVTSLNILDVTGAPWPIQDVSWAGDFEIVEPEEGGHIMRITPMSEFANGNMSIRMLTLKTPLTFTLRTARDIVHYRVDARIPEFGPNAQAPLIEGGTSLVAGDATLTSILDGVPPDGAEKLVVSGVDGRTTAFKIGSVTYVRTPLTLLSPGWDSSMSSADGMNVYAMANTPVLLLSDQGKFMRAHLNEKSEMNVQ